MAVSIDLSGRVAVVTGGAGGIGEGVARALQEAGAHVVLLDRDDRRFAELADVGTGVIADLTDPRSVDGALARVEARSARSTCSSTTPASSPRSSACRS
jgi:NAD(P)-dependent dehydrogenase (short-subunit alcohol dehydrogenase family)